MDPERPEHILEDGLLDLAMHGLGNKEMSLTGTGT